MQIMLCKYRLLLITSHKFERKNETTLRCEVSSDNILNTKSHSQFLKRKNKCHGKMHKECSIRDDIYSYSFWQDRKKLRCKSGYQGNENQPFTDWVEICNAVDHFIMNTNKRGCCRRNKNEKNWMRKSKRYNLTQTHTHTEHWYKLTYSPITVF